MSEPLLSLPRLNIVILVVGTRGDAQPFLAYGQELQSAGHRVRLATHEVFRKLVLENGLEFFPLAGDPSKLMKYAVKNEGIFPSISSFVKGEVWENQRTIGEILKTTWHACIDDDEETGVPFVADVIIANPPSFGHIHCAEKLGVPLHIVFTMPWSATIKFPHPFTLSHRKYNESDQSIRKTYAYIDKYTWMGTSSVINHFRVKTLKLNPLNATEARNMMKDVPHTYCWSPSLVSKPDDWGLHIDVCGYFFLSHALNYTPPQDLLDFLANGSRPIFIGFGSVVGYNRSRLLKIVRKALKKTGRRAVVCNKLATAKDNLPDSMFPLGECSYEWLFQHVDGVCHHGGAGTTAAGLRAGLPTIVIPFFGDQFFWGDVVEKIGAGPPRLSGRNLKTSELVHAIKLISTDPQVRRNAQIVSENIRAERGCEAASRTFYSQLPLEKMHSDLEPTFAASVRIPEYNLQVSWPVAQVLLEAKKIDRNQLIPLIRREWKLTHSNNHPTPLELRIPSNDLPYSSEEREKILNNFSLITNHAQADSQEITSDSCIRTSDMNRLQGGIYKMMHLFLLVFFILLYFYKISEFFFC